MRMFDQPVSDYCCTACFITQCLDIAPGVHVTNFVVTAASWVDFVNITLSDGKSLSGGQGGGNGHHALAAYSPRGAMQTVLEIPLDEQILREFVDTDK